VKIHYISNKQNQRNMRLPNSSCHAIYILQSFLFFLTLITLNSQCHANQGGGICVSQEKMCRWH